MATIKRTALKKLIKECLYEIIRDEDFLKECFVEVLTEGINSKPRTRSLKDVIRPESPRRKPQRRATVENTPVKENKNFEKAVSQYSSNLAGGDAVLANIFADTAKTTLQEQNNSGHASPPVPSSIPVSARGNGMATPDMAEQVASQHSPTDLFEGANKWAQIAFAENSKN